jgi:hypothetical protein
VEESRLARLRRFGNDGKRFAQIKKLVDNQGEKEYEGHISQLIRFATSSSEARIAFLSVRKGKNRRRVR